MSDELKENVIQKVFAFPALWDKSHQHHHNRYVLEKRWKSVASKVGLQEDEVKRMWRNLRREFGKQLKRILKSGVESPESANPQWPFYHSLLFLKDQFSSTNLDDNLGTPEESDNFSDYYNYEDDNVNNPEVSASPHSLSEASGSAQWKNDGAYMEQRRRTQQTGQTAEEKSEMRRQQQKFMDNNDEDIGFFNSLLPHVRQLQPQQKMLFRMQVQQQLYGLLYGFHDSPLIHSTSFANQH